MTLQPGKVVLSNPLTCTNTAKGDNKLYSDAKGVVPSLDLRFAAQKNLNDYITGTPLVDHQRSMFGSNLSAGTFVNSNGLIETAKFNALTANSEVFSGWAVPSTSTATTTSPFNTTAASIDSASALSITVNDPSAVTFSGYFKQGSSRYVYLRSVNWGSVTRIYFDLQLGEFVRQDNPAAPVTDTFATSVGNGWYRCGFTLDSTGDSVGNLQITATDSSTNTSTVGYVFAFGIQVEEGPVSTYIPTTTSASAAPRFDHDPTTGESLGLLIEESRTNAINYSESFAAPLWSTFTAGAGSSPQVTSSAEASPGSTSPTRLVCNLNGGTASSDVSTIQKTVTFTANQTGSIYLKSNTGANQQVYFRVGTVSASVTVTPAWQRFELSETSYSGSANFNVGTRGTSGSDDSIDILIWGAQVEEGSFPTSYIPTTGTALTRSADVASITGSNFSSWYNQSEGTAFVDNSKSTFKTVNFSGEPIIGFDGFGGWFNSQQEWGVSYRYSVDTWEGRVYGAGSSLISGTSQVILPGSYPSPKIAMALSVSDGVRICADGNLDVNNASITGMPTINQLVFQRSTPTRSTHISRFTYFPERLPDATLQAITAP